MAIIHDAPARVGAAPASPSGVAAGGALAALAGHAGSSLAYRSPAARPPRRGKLVGVILGAVVAAALLMAAFIWYRSHAVHEPTTAVIVEGNAALDGTVITVTGARTITTRLTAGNNYAAPVLLEPGRYWVRATHGGRKLLDHEVEVKRFLGVRIKLSDLPSARGAGAGGGGGNPVTRPVGADHL
jgi:hypothetical protein